MKNFKQAKEPATPLAGPYGHPIHPLLVTVPIGAWMSSLVFDGLSAMGRKEDERTYAAGAKTLIDVGIAGAAAASAFGLLDFLRVPRGTRVWYTGLAHMGLNAGALVLFAVNTAARGRRLQRSSPPYVTWGERGLSLATALALLGSGWLGGSLVYHYGVRVADETHQRTTGYGEDGATAVHETAEYRAQPPGMLSL